MAEYLSDDEQIVRLRNWWQRNGVALLIGTLLVVAAVVGWRWYQDNRAERIATASDLYVRYLEAQDDAREQLAADIREQGAGTAYPTFVAFHRAHARVEAGDAAGAETVLREALDASPDALLADLLRVRLAHVLEEQDRSDDALAVLGEVRGQGYLSIANELKGDIHLARGERVQAHQSYATARSHVEEGDQRPLLEIKLADTADAADAAGS